MNLKNEVEKRSTASSRPPTAERRYVPEQKLPYPLSENTPQRTRAMPEEPPAVNRILSPADSQTDWRKPPESWNAEINRSNRQRSTGTAKTWIAKLLPLLAGIGSVSAVLLLLHIIHILI